MSTEHQVTLTDIPRVFDALTAVPGDGKFAVFIFGRGGEAPEGMDPLNVQFSIEAGNVGLDWVLLSPLNTAAREEVSVFLRTRGWEPHRQEMNDVVYLRVEGGDLVQLCRDLLAEVFGVTPTQPLYLISEGFDWPA